MKKIILVYILFAITMAVPVFSQNENTPVQTIRGKISDVESKSPIYASYVILLGTDPMIGTTTDFDGKFKIENVPVGRYDIKITCIGYEDQIIPNVMVGSGKESVLKIAMTESTQKLDAVKIQAEKDKAKTNNDLAMISARGFTVEETKRYAGTFNDPARMASSFAGVSGSPEGNNDIIIRGNSPKGLLWRIEGVESPNPNHFSGDGASGGPISILNSNVLANSDFFTGAFPSNYGNAYSGVFDIELRTGNNEKREYSIEAGFLGTDISLEGPMKKGKDGSYLVNYRYSTLDLLNAMGFKVAGDNVPRYQDAAFKVELPTDNMGRFTIFGVGGLSGIHFEEKDEETEELYYVEDFTSDMFIMGVKHTYLLDDKSYLETTISGSSSGGSFESELANEEGVFFNDQNYSIRNSSLRAQSIYSRKLSARHSVKVGVIYSHLYYDLYNSYRWADDMEMITSLDDEGNASTLQSFVNVKSRLGENLTVTAGIHSFRFNLNNSMSLEPRAGLKYRINPQHSLSAGFGLHSRMETISQYMAAVEMPDGSIAKPNQNLDMSKALHYVFGYSWSMSENLRLNTEIYYQDLFDVPVENDVNSAFSMLNLSEGYEPIHLVNRGTGENYGIDLTLERYFAGGYYFLITNSLYNSRYTALDGVERNTRYNGNYVTNVLGGKEFDMSRNQKKRTFTVSAKGSVAGGNYYTPVDLEQSIEEGRTVRDENNVLGVRADDYQRFDIQLKIRTDKKKRAHEWKLDIQNVTNRLNVVGEYYDDRTQTVKTYTQLGMLPVLSYKIIF